jgi:hypothetical protein
MPDHPPYNDMVLSAIKAMAPKGASREFILKWIHANYRATNHDRTSQYIKESTKRMLARGWIYANWPARSYRISKS